MLTVCCLNAGNYLGRGAEYVAALARGVAANLTRPCRFVCFTEGPLPLDCPAYAAPLPIEGLAGWWNKLALFAPGTFPTGSRVLYLDLDTVAIGRFDAIADYAGPFAALRDFRRVWGLGSGVMAWEAGACDDIWIEWNARGRPLLSGGDQSWIEYMRPDADRLQDLFPRQLVSYKAHCRDGVPAGASLVCFHGLPRPHETALWPNPRRDAA